MRWVWSNQAAVESSGVSFQRVLIIEDDSAIRKTLVRLASEWAREVVPVGTLREARQEVSRSFDLLVTDVRLPDGTIFDIVEAVAERPARPKIVVISGAASPEEVFRLAKVGADAFLSKPFGLTEARNALAKVATREGSHPRSVTPPSVSTLELRLEAFARANGLTEQHTALLRALLRGVPRKQLAAALGISENTCKTLVRRLLARCGADRMADIVNELLAREAASTADDGAAGAV